MSGMSGECGSSKDSSCGKSSVKMGVKTVTKEELQKKIQVGNVQVVNVLDPKWYELGIIQGSRKIPLKELDRRLGELDKSKEVVTYCASYECSASKEAAQMLAAKGFKVSAYEGGIKEWTSAGLPTEGKTKGSSCCGGSSCG
ncbi:MAG: rhodanese-like domain-containing protein [Candidatus Omnitrophica bacterium]|nr:rhodanese-like domain-containing protein [Candidatus Omnitrophota bacterium]